ncbi:MAG: hypothetical protein ACOCP8_00200 [archaeon]
MNKEMQDVINAISIEFNKEIDKTIDILLRKAKIKRRGSQKDIQVNLIENGYDLVQYAFKKNPLKRLIALTNIGNKFIEGYLVEYDVKDGKLIKKLIKHKSQFEKIIKEI